MSNKGDIIVGLDIGTTKICAVVGMIKDKSVEILGMGSHPSEGLRKGVVVNIEATVESIKKAVAEAELMSSCEVTSVITGIAGGHIKGFSSHGVLAVRGREVTAKDKERVVDAARAVAIPTDREVIHILPQEFILDGQKGIQDPVGMSGVRLEAKVHMVTGAVASAHNLIKCCNQAGLDVADIVLQSLASAEAVLTAEEMSLGAALVDFGGGTTDLAIFGNDAIKHTAGLALGGINLTTDLAVGLRTPMAEAEKLKTAFGCAMVGLAGKDEMINVPGVGGRQPRKAQRRILGEILEPRVEELLTLLQMEIERSGFKNQIAGGVVLTGGSAQLDGLVEMSEQVFNMPARMGSPAGVLGLADVVSNPKYSTAVGLVLYGARNKNEEKFRIRDANIFNRITGRMRRWFNKIM
ncbi:cell division protein FtsA [Desulfarculus baarsii DSM 2075]|uniref:Cell division protein FtsA n=1 Tax=Desulfarculus baarsii (strain ATCC 33931 / DSM 2075 / LMG 7858 / VKM B-1802 / 2st14) TaxID=644282 RepID=E1QMA8_DESB2|nr:cell division protein FtsA [Desulfarculus baarsii]ADK86151.1 cell division protein FtsA [Desulfarculus baarsii DSM 2075]